MKAPKRGIEPAALLSLVDNTASFLFTPKFETLPYVQTLASARTAASLNHLEYFRLCLSAHYGTVATFVPTDVDNQIRKHLWDENLPLATTDAMAALVLESHAWEFRPVTTRFTATEGSYISGHQGEWFSVAAGAYASHRQRNPNLAAELTKKILEEVRGEARIFNAFKKQKNGVELLRTSTLIAHNLGDLDRVIDQWELPPEDPLRRAVYKLGHEKHPEFGADQAALIEAGNLNKAFMASENHRHYPLRKPKSLRGSADFLLPLGPFFDAWGSTVGSHPSLSSEEKAEVADALLDGFTRLSSPKIPLYGYARALLGLQNAFPGGMKGLAAYLPAKAAKSLGKGELGEIQRPSAEAFAGQWAKKALNFLKLA